jgi:hypothetical protein
MVRLPAGVVTRENGAPAGGIAVVPSIAPCKLVGPPRSEGTVVTVMTMFSPTEVAPILATITSPDGRYGDNILSGFVQSAFSHPAVPLDDVFIYVWQDGWIEHRNCDLFQAGYRRTIARVEFARLRVFALECVS